MLASITLLREYPQRRAKSMNTLGIRGEVIRRIRMLSPDIVLRSSQGQAGNSPTTTGIVTTSCSLKPVPCFPKTGTNVRTNARHRHPFLWYACSNSCAIFLPSSCNGEGPGVGIGQADFVAVAAIPATKNARPHQQHKRQASLVLTQSAAITGQAVRFPAWNVV